MHHYQLITAKLKKQLNIWEKIFQLSQCGMVIVILIECVTRMHAIENTSAKFKIKHPSFLG